MKRRGLGKGRGEGKGMKGMREVREERVRGREEGRR